MKLKYDMCCHVGTTGFVHTLRDVKKYSHGQGCLLLQRATTNMQPMGFINRFSTVRTTFDTFNTIVQLLILAGTIYLVIWCAVNALILLLVRAQVRLCRPDGIETILFCISDLFWFCQAKGLGILTE